MGKIERKRKRGSDRREREEVTEGGRRERKWGRDRVGAREGEGEVSGKASALKCKRSWV